MNLVRAIAGIVLVAVALISGGATRMEGTGVPAGDPVKGKQVYANANPKCSLCHRIGNVGGPLGPELTAVGTRRDAAWLGKFLPNPKSKDPQSKMPPVTAKGKDLENLIAYLVSLKGK